MKRLHAILLLLRIAACVAVMIGKEVWVYWRKQHRKPIHGTSK